MSKRRKDRSIALALITFVVPSLVSASAVVMVATGDEPLVDCASQLAVYAEYQENYPEAEISLPPTSEVQIQCNINETLDSLQENL